VTTLLIEHIPSPSTTRDARVLRFLRESAADALGGRTVWCVGEAPEEVPAGTRVEVRAQEPARVLAERIDALLHGAGAGPAGLGAAERELCAQAVCDTPSAVAADDIVLLSDAVAAFLAQAVREHGAHAVWCMSFPAAPSGAAAREAWEFLRPYMGGVDAYVARWGAGVAAAMPRADVVSVKSELEGELAWRSLLADVVRDDRAETVGGTLRPRPAVAVR
jgi:hypothetical protein